MSDEIVEVEESFGMLEISMISTGKYKSKRVKRRRRGKRKAGARNIKK